MIEGREGGDALLVDLGTARGLVAVGLGGGRGEGLGAGLTLGLLLLLLLGGGERVLDRALVLGVEERVGVLLALLEPLGVSVTDLLLLGLLVRWRAGGERGRSAMSRALARESRGRTVLLGGALSVVGSSRGGGTGR